MKWTVLLALAVTIPFLATPPAAASEVTLDEFLTLLKERHPFFTSERLAADIAAEEQVGLSGAEDWHAFSSATITHEQATLGGFGPDKTTAVALRGGIRRTIWRTGGRVSATAGVFRADLDAAPLLGLPDYYYETELGVSYVHPLLRNRSGVLDRLEHSLKDYDIRSAEILAVEAEEQFLEDATYKFLDWAFLTEQNEIIKQRLELSKEELQRTIRKRNAYLIDEADVIRAQDAVRFWEQTLALGESQWHATRAELSVLAQDDELLSASPVYGLYEIPEVPSLEEARATLSAESRLLRDLDIRAEQLRRLRLGFEETAKPDLTLVAELHSRGAQDEMLESLVLDKPDLVLSLQYGLPLKNTTANSDIARTDLELRRLEARRSEAELALLAGLSAIHTQMSELDTVLVLNREQIESARRRTEEELDLYNHGRGELTFVILSRDNEQQARLTHAQNALGYHKLLVAYRALLDELHSGN